MARTVRDPKLDTPTARGKLGVSGKPYYRAIDTNLHVGYRKNQSGGKWVVRYYLGDEKYSVETIGVADDGQEADGTTILNWSQAQAKARELNAARRKPKAAAGPLTVGMALDAYLARLDAEHRKSANDARSRIEKHIRPALGTILVAEITRENITGWRNNVAAQPRHVRGKKGQVSRELAAPANDDERRRRKASTNRTMTVLRAALNMAFQDRKEVLSDTAWRAVKPFKETEVARIRYFSQEEVMRLVNAAQGPFRRLVNAALFTGCRYGELARLRVGDFNADAGTVFVANSKSGKARHVILTEEGQRFFSQLTAGRPTDFLMLTKADGGHWGYSHQLRPMAEACQAARISNASFHILRHTAASHNVMGGVPLPVVAQNLGHADSRMTEKHYGHMAPSYVAETIRKFAPTFGTVETLNVAELKVTGTAGR